MRILFLARRYAYFRNFESVLRNLASHGHEIHLAVERADDQRAMIERLAAQFACVTFGEAPARAADDWAWVASRLRLGLDYLRYQHPQFDDTPKLRERARERTPGLFVTIGDGLRRHARWLRRPLSAVVRNLERAVPSDGTIQAFIRERHPDAVLITPLVDVGSSQIDYLRAAQEAGLPTGLCVWSWDHLSSKALIRDCPDRIFVWNEVQKHEAVHLHGVPASRVVVTGAQCFDKWFDRHPSRGLGRLCSDSGLPGTRPYLLYVCSAPFLGSQPEAPFVIEWIRRIRSSSDTTLASIPILVRPHPSRVREWHNVDLHGFDNVSLWGSNPVDEPSQADYFDSLYHSAAVVGLNTSTFIEAGILGRPVLTILLPEWHDNQMGTLHFRYLLDLAGGLVRAAKTFDDHLRQLGETLSSPPSGVRPFVEEFVRPHGLDAAATPRFVRNVEELAQIVKPVAAGQTVLEPVSRWLLGRVGARRHSRSLEWWLYSSDELTSIRRRREHRAVMDRKDAVARSVREAAKRERQAARQRRLEDYRARKAVGSGDSEQKREVPVR